MNTIAYAGQLSVEMDTTAWPALCLVGGISGIA